MAMYVYVCLPWLRTVALYQGGPPALVFSLAFNVTFLVKVAAVGLK